MLPLYIFLKELIFESPPSNSLSEGYSWLPTELPKYSKFACWFSFRFFCFIQGLHSILSSYCDLEFPSGCLFFFLSQTEHGAFHAFLIENGSHVTWICCHALHSLQDLHVSLFV